jgi:hypothetical protein
MVPSAPHEKEKYLSKLVMVRPVRHTQFYELSQARQAERLGAQVEPQSPLRVVRRKNESQKRRRG